MIEKMAIEAKKLGMTYGKYVASLDKDQAEEYDPRPKKRKCICCGELFTPWKTKSGNVTTSKKCKECKQGFKVFKKVRGTSNRPRKEYTLKCTRCGAEVVTTQPPRQVGNLYCKECRVIVAKERSRESKRKRRKKC